MGMTDEELEAYERLEREVRGCQQKTCDIV